MCEMLVHAARGSVFCALHRVQLTVFALLLLHLHIEMSPLSVFLREMLVHAARARFCLLRTAPGTTHCVCFAFITPTHRNVTSVGVSSRDAGACGARAVLSFAHCTGYNSPCTCRNFILVCDTWRDCHLPTSRRQGHASGRHYLWACYHTIRYWHTACVCPCRLGLCAQ